MRSRREPLCVRVGDSVFPWGTFTGQTWPASAELDQLWSDCFWRQGPEIWCNLGWFRAMLTASSTLFLRFRPGLGELDRISSDVDECRGEFHQFRTTSTDFGASSIFTDQSSHRRVPVELLTDGHVSRRDGRICKSRSTGSLPLVSARKFGSFTVQPPEGTDNSTGC